MATNKYIELTEKTLVITRDGEEVTLHQIRATQDMPWHPARLKRVKYIKKGALGGWVESLDNVQDKAWVDGNAMVYGDALVSDMARVTHNASVYGNAVVSEVARVSHDASVHGNAVVSGMAEVYGNAEVYGWARVGEEAGVSGYAKVYGWGKVFGKAEVRGSASVCDYALVHGYALVEEAYCVAKSAEVGGNVSLDWQSKGAVESPVTERMTEKKVRKAIARSAFLYS